MLRAEGRSWVRRFPTQFHPALVYLPIAASILTLAIGHPADARIIFTVVIANAVIGLVQEGRAERAMSAIRDMLAARAAVLRDGMRMEMDADRLVPGDVVLLKAGDRVPADLSLIAAAGLRVQEAVLTGESAPVKKDGAPAPRDAPLGDRYGIAFAGTAVAAGQAQGLVTAKGEATELGRIGAMLSRVETLAIPLPRKMDRFSGRLTASILLLAAALMAYGLLMRGYPEGEPLMAVVGLSVAAIPEGLRAVLTITLAIGVQAMAQRNAIVRRYVDADQAALDHNDLRGMLQFVGLVGLIDPPSPVAIAAVAECRSAGIQVKMITDDHAGAAAAIERQVGLARPQTVVTGAEIDATDDEALARAAPAADIFARTSPSHKLRLVAALQTEHRAAAMTGDGVTDAPALKRADVGVAMGGRGSDMAREAANIVLVDDDYISIAAAGREGRTVYDNLCKVIAWLLPTSGSEALVIVAALLLRLALPIPPVQILWINLVTTVTLGLALAFEPTETDTMRRPPRPGGAPILDGTLLGMSCSSRSLRSPASSASAPGRRGGATTSRCRTRWP